MSFWNSGLKTLCGQYLRRCVWNPLLVKNPYCILEDASILIALGFIVTDQVWQMEEKHKWREMQQYAKVSMGLNGLSLAGHCPLKLWHWNWWAKAHPTISFIFLLHTIAYYHVSLTTHFFAPFVVVTTRCWHFAFESNNFLLCFTPHHQIKCCTLMRLRPQGQIKGKQCTKLRTNYDFDNHAGKGSNLKVTFWSIRQTYKHVPWAVL